MTQTISNDVLNGDWNFHPVLRYASSLLLTGTILVDGVQALHINCVEPYSRDTMLDAHHERRFGGESSFPLRCGRYGFLRICNLQTVDGSKLVVGSSTSNFLITSSLRLDKESVEVGPSTKHFAASDDSRLFINSKSLGSVKEMIVNTTNHYAVNNSQQLPAMYLLKQVQSKFDCLSTYTMCRASSTATARLDMQPTSMWTLCDEDSTQKISSDKKLGSMVFKAIALEVMQNGRIARLRFEIVDGILKQAKEKLSRTKKAKSNIVKTLKK